MTTRFPILIGLVAALSLGACTTSSPGTNLGARGIVYFENIANPLDPVELRVGSMANEICAWKEDGEDGDGGIDDDEPALYLTEYVIKSSNPKVATFAIAGTAGTSESACVNTTVLATGTVTLSIEAADGTELDHIEIPVLAR